jgi:hypothetical protein
MDDTKEKTAVQLQAKVPTRGDPKAASFKYELKAHVAFFGKWRNAVRVAALLRKPPKRVLVNGVCANAPQHIFKRAEEVAKAAFAKSHLTFEQRDMVTTLVVTEGDSNTTSSDAFGDAFDAPHKKLGLDDDDEEGSSQGQGGSADAAACEEALLARGWLTTPLLPHQRVGVAWMRRQEGQSDPTSSAGAA